MIIRDKKTIPINDTTKHDILRPNKQLKSIELGQDCQGKYIDDPT
jgi:hypothetical protein